MKRLLPTCIFLLGIAAVLPGVAAEGAADGKLRALYEKTWEWRQSMAARVRDEDGRWTRGDRLPTVTAASQAERLAYYEAALSQLEAIDSAALSDGERINAAVFRQILESDIADLRFRQYEAPINSDTFFWSGLHPRAGGFRSAEGYERYLGRLEDLPRYFAEQRENMRAGLARGFTPPAITLVGREASLEPYLSPGEDNPFWGPMTRLPRAVSDAEAAVLRERVRALIDSAVVPAYRDMLAFMREEYLPGARSELAARTLPDGEAYYRAQIRKFVTLDMTPEEIHEKGLSEVARIRGEMEAILEEVDFDGDMAAFFDFLRTDPQFYAKTPDELMGVSAYVAKRMDGELDRVLGFLPRHRFAIRPVPDAIAPVYTAGRGGYESCLMNTYNLPVRPLYTIPALTLHECAPGHALQAAIAREAPTDVPEFRAYNYFSGYGEGWGLYTEWLGGEVGIYRTPYERFGQLTYEMWRACRLVIDTGVHWFGWDRDRAQAYLRDNAAMSEHEITTEVDRYISWPAQALAYKLGELVIRGKRGKAEAVLGTDFDQRYFHDTILALRSVPLNVLGQQLDFWIADGGPDPYADADID